MLHSLTFVVLGLGPVILQVQEDSLVEFPPAPGIEEFCVDLADVVDFADEAEVQRIGLSSTRDSGVPFWVITLPSLEALGAGGFDLDRYSRLLMREWGYDQFPAGDRSIVFCVALEERQARVSLGAGFEAKRHEAARAIMRDTVLPRFRKGEFSAGVTAGARRLNDLVLGDTQPLREASWPLRSLLVLVGLILLATFISVGIHGQRGWAWRFWSFTLTFPITALDRLQRGSWQFRSARGLETLDGNAQHTGAEGSW